MVPYKKYLQLFIGLIFSMSGLVWVFSGVNFIEITKIIKEVSIEYIFLSILFIFCAIFFRSLIFSSFASQKYDLRLSFLYKNQLIGYFANNFIPFRIGELVRVYILNKNIKEKDSKFFIIIILIERILDLLSLLLLLVIILPFLYLPTFIYDWSIFNLFYLVLFAIFTFILFFIFKTFYPNFFISFKQKFLSDFVIFEKYLFLKSFTLSICVWFCFLLYTNAIQKSLGFELTIFDCLIILTLSALVQIIPSAPGSIGTYHAAVKYLSATLFDVPELKAVSFSIMLHSVSYFSFTIIGAIFFINSNYKIAIKNFELKNSSND